MTFSRLLGVVVLGGSLVSCAAKLSEESAGPVPEDSEPTAEDALELGRRYVTERAYRRQVLEGSLLYEDNHYAELRLESYGVEPGWESLPELEVATTPLVYRERVRVEDAPTRVWSGDVEWSEASLLALGKTAFERWPSQPLPTVELALGEREEASAARSLGLWQDDDGWLGGLVWASYASGATVLAATCATCHAQVNTEGKVEHGPASNIDLGDGAGKLDVTADGAHNPVAIADLRATAHQRRLHWTGNVENGLLPLAVRIETLLVTNSGSLTRPPRELAFALALYVLSLGGGDEVPASGASQGSSVFEQTCARCHDGRWGAGDWVSVEEVGTDAAATLSGERGTGGYRVSSLRFVSTRTRFTHEGYEGSLESFLDPTRSGIYAGHPFGFDLDDRERAALIEYLSTW